MEEQQSSSTHIYSKYRHTEKESRLFSVLHLREHDSEANSSTYLLKVEKINLKVDESFL